jgi:DhnA family fructose-bisphosphate aldolase class Ia
VEDLSKKYDRSLGSYQFDTGNFFSKPLYDAITDVRIERKEIVSEESKARVRRPHLTTNGKLTILAADHPGRMVISYGDNPILMGDRHEYLGHVLRVLLGSDFDGVMGTPDIIEELFIVSWLYRQKHGESFLDNRVVIGTMNRGGLLGTVFEMDDRFTSYTAQKISELRLDGAKFMFRLEENESGSGKTMYYCAKVIEALNQLGLPAFLEALPVRKDATGYPVRKDAESLVKVIGVATAMGDSSLNLWIKIPYCDGYKLVAASTTCPILMLGGASKGNPIPVLKEFEEGLKAGRNVRGILVGRNILFPGPDDPACVAQAAHQIVHMGQSVDEAIGVMGERRGNNLGILAGLIELSSFFNRYYEAS